jgi:hypothetical protein
MGIKRGSTGGFKVPELQADAVLSQANPVSGTKYAVLPTTRNVRIIGSMIYVTWTVQPNPLELHMLVDGIQCTWAQANPVSPTFYYPYNHPGYAANSQYLDTTRPDNRVFLLEGRSIFVEAEITGGTVNPLVCRVKYEKW